MDKAKEILGVIRRQHFWIVAPLLFIVGFFGWIVASGKLAKEFTANQSTVKGYITTMKGVSGGGSHPNQEYLDGMEQLIAARRDNVKKAWEKKWERQKQLLKWPEALGRELIDQVDSMRPIEMVDPSKKVNGVYLRNYARFVKEELPRLATMMGAKWSPTQLSASASFGGGEKGRRSGEGATSSESGDDTLVLWSAQNQTEIAERYPWDDTLPTTHEMLYAQEDLWVLNNLAQIIKKTNGDAIARSQAAIKEIRFIKIGKDVDPPSRGPFDVIRPAELGADPAAAPDASTVASTDGLTRNESGSAPSVAVDSENRPLVADPIAELVKNRYYDDKYEWIADLQTLKSSGTVAKRIPVRMLLLIDQRHINKLLVEAANADLTLEVIQLRMNPVDTSTGLGMMNNRSSEGRGIITNQPRTLKDYHSYDRVVELLGIIYIFNPVNNDLLGSAPAETAPAPTTPATETGASALVERPSHAART